MIAVIVCKYVIRYCGSPESKVGILLPKSRISTFHYFFHETEIFLNYIHQLTKYTSEYTLTFISKSLLQSMYELASSMRKQFHQIETRDQEIEEDDSSKEMRSNSTFFGTLDSFNGRMYFHSGKIGTF